MTSSDLNIYLNNVVMFFDLLSLNLFSCEQYFFSFCYERGLVAVYAAAAY